MARVEDVKPGSPAEKAGIKIGDVILKVARRRDPRRQDLSRGYRRASAPATEVPIHIRRGGDEMDVTVTLAGPAVPVRARERHRPARPDRLRRQGGRRRPARSGRSRKPGSSPTTSSRRRKNGADFNKLVKTYSEDAGIGHRRIRRARYAIVQDGKPKPTPDARAWSEWVPGFSAVSFALDVGDVAMTAPIPS